MKCPSINALCTRRVCAVLASLVTLAAPHALAQTFPAKPIEMVIHSNPGAGQDTFGRLVADISQREKLLPQPFTIVNRPGGSGAVASTFIKSKRGDPHFMLSLSSTIVLALANRPDIGLALDTYTPVALFGFDLQSITVPVDSRFKTFKDLVEASKQVPDSIVNGIASATGTARFLQYQIEKATGARMKYVSFKSGGDAMAAVMGKHVDLTMENVSEVLSGVEAKKLRILAVPAAQRLTHLPDVPTLKELGFDIHVGGGRGLAMPAGVPRETLTVMEAFAERVHKSAQWRDYAAKNMYENTFLNSAALTQYLNKQMPVVGEFMSFIGSRKP
jgi:putative tricarboxylic transport membrane protein